MNWPKLPAVIYCPGKFQERMGQPNVDLGTWFDTLTTDEIFRFRSECAVRNSRNYGIFDGPLTRDCIDFLARDNPEVEEFCHRINLHNANLKLGSNDYSRRLISMRTDQLHDAVEAALHRDALNKAVDDLLGGVA